MIIERDLLMADLADLTECSTLTVDRIFHKEPPFESSSVASASSFESSSAASASSGRVVSFDLDTNTTFHKNVWPLFEDEVPNRWYSRREFKMFMLDCQRWARKTKNRSPHTVSEKGKRSLSFQEAMISTFTACRNSNVAERVDACVVNSDAVSPTLLQCMATNLLGVEKCATSNDITGYNALVRSVHVALVKDLHEDADCDEEHIRKESEQISHCARQFSRTLALALERDQCNRE
jgi:hypothetical protein